VLQRRQCEEHRKDRARPSNRTPNNCVQTLIYMIVLVFVSGLESLLVIKEIADDHSARVTVCILHFGPIQPHAKIRNSKLKTCPERCRRIRNSKQFQMSKVCKIPNKFLRIRRFGFSRFGIYLSLSLFRISIFGLGFVSLVARGDNFFGHHGSRCGCFI